MKEKKSLKNKILIGLTVAGGLLTVTGVPLFIVGGVGTYRITQNVAPNTTKLESSGYFNQGKNFSILSSHYSETFNKKTASNEGFNFNIIGFCKWYNSSFNTEKNSVPNPTLNAKLFPQFINISQYDKLINHTMLDNNLFISGAVLWPIGLTTLLVSGLLFFIFRAKEKDK